MNALSLRLPDSVHRHINGRTYQQWAEVVQGVDLILYSFRISLKVNVCIIIYDCIYLS